MKYKKKNRKPGKITILLIPGTTAGAHSLSVSRQMVAAITVGMVVFIMIFVGLSYGMYSAREDMKNITQLKKENRQKSEQIEELGQKVLNLKKQKETIQEQQEEIKRLMGISQNIVAHDKTPSRGTGGGGERPYSLESPQLIQQQMDSFGQCLEAWEDELSKIKADVQRNQDYYLSLPNHWPVAGRITSEFGSRKSPFGRREEFHGGLDVAADAGTPVQAAGRGKVVYVGRDRVYGRLVKIDHGRGIITWYGHNSQVLVEEGDKVDKGQVIARVGSSGRSTGPHLHFTVEVNGVPCDPLAYLGSVRS